jgi:hypothetical protein
MNATNVITVGKETLATIKGVNLEYCGRIGFDPEAATQFCENWLYEQESVDVDADEVGALVVSAELATDQAIVQAVVDAAFLAWLESQESEPTGADGVAVTAIM